MCSARICFAWSINGWRCSSVMSFHSLPRSLLISAIVICGSFSLISCLLRVDQIRKAFIGLFTWSLLLRCEEREEVFEAGVLLLICFEISFGEQLIDKDVSIPARLEGGGEGSGWKGFIADTTRSLSC